MMLHRQTWLPESLAISVPPSRLNATVPVGRVGPVSSGATKTGRAGRAGLAKRHRHTASPLLAARMVPSGLNAIASTSCPVISEPSGTG
jgi:hypothetical protein